ncbi:P protein [Orussus abietinus]|uniref:P protein n=1 Tax=Orussus abietinus TaxID=222816 RepID=UPI00062607D2|nr:P protein [Orussus abietinus]
MSLHPEGSEDETVLLTPKFLRKASRYNRSAQATPSLITSGVFGPFSEEVLRVWSQLPDAIRLDPSLAAFQKEYEKIVENDEKRICGHGTDEEDPHDAGSTHDHIHEGKQKPVYRYVKLILLICCWLIFTIILMTKSEKVEVMRQMSVPSNQTRNYIFTEPLQSDLVSITLEGSFLPVNANLSKYTLTVWLELVDVEKNNGDGTSYERGRCLKNISEPWILHLLPEDLLNIFPNQRRHNVFHLEGLEENLPESVVAMNLRTNLLASFPVSVGYDVSPIDTKDGTVYGAIVLLGLYVLIVFEVVHRALAAMLASTMSVAILAALNERPTMGELISWIDVDTLLLLFSMMVLVAIFAETGIFDYLSVYAYKITGGKLWPLVNTLCFFTAFISLFLDNVTTVLLMTPVTIRLCEVMELNPVPILTAMVVYSNIGGAITPIGDPPNVIIASNKHVMNAGVDFTTFVIHMGIGVILVLFVVYAQLRFIFRDVSALRFDEPQDVQELRHEIAIWQRAAASLSSYSKDEGLVRETLMKKVRRLLSELKKKLITGSVALENYKTTLEELQERYPIRDKWLLIKSGFTLIFVITLFFLHSIPNFNLSLGWTALLGVILLLVLADSADLDGLMARVEWSTLLFFAALFILMEALSRLGLIAWIGRQTEKIILSVDEDSRLAVAILLILWVSAVASAFVDNVPLSTMMVRIATNLAEKKELGLPLQPLVWALAFGACMGGNGTLIGATANVVCAGVAEQHGYKFTFVQFFKVGFPVMITSTAIVSVYLMIAHVVFEWNG